MHLADVFNNNNNNKINKKEEENQFVKEPTIIYNGRFIRDNQIKKEAREE